MIVVWHDQSQCVTCLSHRYAAPRWWIAARASPDPMDEIESLRAVVTDGVHQRCISPERGEKWLSQRLGGRAVKFHYDHPLVNGRVHAWR